MTVIGILVAWWVFLVFVACAICRAAAKPVPPIQGWRNGHR